MQALSRFIRENRDGILEQWLIQVCDHPPARGLPRAELEDHIPDLLDALADAIDGVDGAQQMLRNLPVQHAGERLKLSFDLRHVVHEYRILRSIILDQYRSFAGNITEGEPGGPGAAPREHLSPLIILNELIDHAITDAVEQYYRERTQAMEWFVGILGHDLRNPLNLIELNTQLLLRSNPALDPPARQAARTITKTARRMARLVNDLLDFSRGRAGQMIPLRRRRIELGRMVNAIVAEFTHSHPDRDIRVKTEGTDLHGFWDPDRLSQIVANLLGNAIQHGSDPVRIHLTATDPAVIMRVVNRGAISPEMQSELFQPYRVAGAQRGTGLGLLISREVAHAHGGRLDIEYSDEASGTSFLLKLPRGNPTTGGTTYQR